MSEIAALSSVVQQARLGRFSPRTDDSMAEAAHNFAEFYCYMVAKTFTECFETDNFDQQMTYTTFFPEALGALLAESGIGQTLEEGAVEVMSADHAQEAVAFQVASERYQKMLHVTEEQHSHVTEEHHSEEYVPAEMLEEEKWIC
jgi:hypothetical protein